jgi:hypothetical protein
VWRKPIRTGEIEHWKKLNLRLFFNIIIVDSNAFFAQLLPPLEHGGEVLFGDGS